MNKLFSMRFFVLGAFILLNLNVKAFDKNVPIDDTIFLKSGNFCIGKVTEISDSEIKYKRLDMEDGPIMILSRNTVEKIRYSNGIVEHITPVASNYYLGRKVPGNAIAGIFVAILGFIVAGIILGTISIILGAGALKKIKKEPMKFKGKGLAIAIIVMGIIDIAGAIYVILTS